MYDDDTSRLCVQYKHGIEVQVLQNVLEKYIKKDKLLTRILRHALFFFYKSMM